MTRFIRYLCSDNIYIGLNRQNAARNALFSYSSGTRKDGILQREAVCSCLRAAKQGMDSVEIWHIPTHMRAKLEGLQRCKSVWHCAVCAGVITAHREGELRQAHEAALALGLRCIMVTYTVPHKPNEGLFDVKDRLLRARRNWRSRRDYRNWRDKYGVVGSIRALEVTWGASGWHPHIHELFFIEAGKLGDSVITEHKYKAELFPQWRDAVARVGGGECSPGAMSVDDTDARVSEYVAKFGRQQKWSSETEMVKGAMKKGRTGNRLTPFQLCDALQETGEKIYYDKWVEYAFCMKGARQLVWSHGLRGALLGDDKEVSDSDIFELNDGKGVRLGVLSLPDFKTLCDAGERENLYAIACSGNGSEYAALCDKYFITRDRAVTRLDPRFESTLEARIDHEIDSYDRAERIKQRSVYMDKSDVPIRYSWPSMRVLDRASSIVSGRIARRRDSQERLEWWADRLETYHLFD